MLCKEAKQRGCHMPMVQAGPWPDVRVAHFVNFEITYHESSLDWPLWDPARRGEYDIDKCCWLTGSVV